MMTLYYESSEGVKINLLGDGIYCQNPESLIVSDFEPDTVSGTRGKTRVKRMQKQPVSVTLELDVMTDTASEFNDLMRKLDTCLEKDNMLNVPGRIWWNDYYLDFYTKSKSNTEFEEMFESVTKKIDMYIPCPYWTKVSTYVVPKSTTSSIGLDYEFDYGFDYCIPENVQIVVNDCIKDANFVIKFHGPTEFPRVLIDGHEYSVFTELEENETVTVSSVDQTVVKTLADGTEENVFHLRNKESDIFEKLKRGVLNIAKSEHDSIDLVIFDERGEPARWI